MSRVLSALIVDISASIDASYPDGLDAEAHRWRRCMKVSEEAGEVTEALLGLTGENPRKGVTHDLDAVGRELLDVALAALGAYAHLHGNVATPVTDLTDHAMWVHTQLMIALAPDSTDGEG